MIEGQPTDTPITPVAAETPIDPGAPSAEDDALGAIYDRAMGEGGDEDAGGEQAVAETRARDATGKFTKQNPAETPEGPEATDDQLAGDSDRQAPTGLPANWRPDMAPVWDKLDPAARDTLGKWSQEIHSKMSDLGRQNAQYRDIQPVLDDMLQSYPDRFQGPEAMTPAAAVKFLYSVQKDMDERPEETILEIAARYNVIPSLAQRLGANGGSPDIHMLQSTIQQLENRLAGLVSPDNINQQISRAMSEREVAASVERFKTEKPFYADVESDLPQFIDIAWGRKPDANALEVLAEAYDMAVFANPATREKALAASRQAAAKPDPKAAAARKAASINVQSTSLGKQKPRSEEEAMGQAYDKLMAS